MDFYISDIVFYLTLLACITLGEQYKKLTNMDIKRSYGTGLGILVTYLICGYYIYHTVFIVWGNIILIKCCNRQYLHQLSLFYTWTYLGYLVLNLDYAGIGYALWVFQVIALRLVGLSYELHLNAKNYERHRNASKTKQQLDQDEISNITVYDVIAYSYYFIGLHKGPYYRWKVFQEHFNTPFGVMGNFRTITERKLRKAAAYTALYIILRSIYPLKLYYDKDFYSGFSPEARYFYNIPQLILFGLQHLLVMSLCTSVCTEAGFGVYPARCLALPGHGPSARRSLLSMSQDDPAILEQQYNFAMLRCIDTQKCIFGPSMRDSLKSWDMATRYWFVVYAYRHTIKARSNFRNALAYLLWALWWGGPKLQYVILALTIWTHIFLEHGFIQLFSRDYQSSTWWNVGLSTLRIICLVYLTPCLVIPDQSVVFKYYNSIGWIIHIAFFIVLVCYLCVHRKYSEDTITTIF